jgi:hypothetical protein
MALTRKFKNLIGFVVIAGVVGGGIYYYKTMPKRQPQEQSVDVGRETPEQATQRNDTIQPLQPEQPKADLQPPSPPSEAEAQAQPEDPSSNRGLKFLLKQGSK